MAEDAARRRGAKMNASPARGGAGKTRSRKRDVSCGAARTMKNVWRRHLLRGIKRPAQSSLYAMSILSAAISSAVAVVEACPWSAAWCACVRVCV